MYNSTHIVPSAHPFVVVGSALLSNGGQSNSPDGSSSSNGGGSNSGQNSSSDGSSSSNSGQNSSPDGTSTNSNSGNSGGKNRKKRSSKSSGASTDDGLQLSLTQVDFDTDAQFVKEMMSLPENIRKQLGHSLGHFHSVIENGSRMGFLFSCTFKGSNCSDER